MSKHWIPLAALVVVGSFGEEALAQKRAAWAVDDQCILSAPAMMSPKPGAEGKLVKLKQDTRLQIVKVLPAWFQVRTANGDSGYIRRAQLRKRCLPDATAPLEEQSQAASQASDTASSAQPSDEVAPAAVESEPGTAVATLSAPPSAAAAASPMQPPRSDPADGMGKVEAESGATASIQEDVDPQLEAAAGSVTEVRARSVAEPTPSGVPEPNAQVSEQTPNMLTPVVGYAALGLGGALVIAGTIFVATRDDMRTAYDAENHVLHVTRSQSHAPGYGMVVTGGVLAAAGATLLVAKLLGTDLLAGLPLRLAVCPQGGTAAFAGTF